MLIKVNSLARRIFRKPKHPENDATESPEQLRLQELDHQLVDEYHQVLDFQRRRKHEWRVKNGKPTNIESILTELYDAPIYQPQIMPHMERSRPMRSHNTCPVPHTMFELGDHTGKASVEMDMSIFEDLVGEAQKRIRKRAEAHLPLPKYVPFEQPKEVPKMAPIRIREFPEPSDAEKKQRFMDQCTAQALGCEGRPRRSRLARHRVLAKNRPEYQYGHNGVRGGDKKTVAQCMFIYDRAGNPIPGEMAQRKQKKADEIREYLLNHTEMEQRRINRINMYLQK